MTDHPPAQGDHPQDPVPVEPSLPRATRQRYGVVAFAVTLAMITYIDRICLSEAAPRMREELSISKVDMGYVFVVFAWMYGLFEIPWGWMGDKSGTRKILMRVVILWSLFTAATGWVWNRTSLLVSQAFFGAGEAGCFPNLAKAFTTWLPVSERVRAQGFLWLSARWGGAFTPLVVVLLLRYMSWRFTFGVFALVGVVWAILFYRWYRDNPRDNPGVNSAELALLSGGGTAPIAPGGKVPWKKFFSTPSVWCLWWQYFCLAYGANFYQTWLPTYLEEGRKVELHQGAFLAGLPLFFAGLGSLFCGLFLSPLAKWMGGPRRARRLMAMTGFLASGGLLILSTRIESALWAMVVMGAAGFANDLAMPSSWGSSMDMGGRFAGTLSASMNMMSCLGAAGAAWMTPHILERWTANDWNVVLYCSAGAYFLGAFFWIFLDPVTPVDRPLENPGPLAHQAKLDSSLP